MTRLIKGNRKGRLDRLLEVDDPVFDAEETPEETNHETLLFAKDDGLYVWRKIATRPTKIVDTPDYHFIQILPDVRDENFFSLLDSKNRLSNFYVDGNHLKLETAKSILTTVTAICSYNNSMAMAGLWNDAMQVLWNNDEGITKTIVEKRVNCLCGHEGKLYAGFDNGIIYDCREKTPLDFDVETPINALYSFNGQLYAACGPVINPVFESKLIEIKTAKGNVLGLGSFDNKLIDCGDYGIGNLGLSFLGNNDPVYAVCSASPSIYDKRLEE